MNLDHSQMWLLRRIAPLAVGLGLAAMPALAGACDMKAVDDQLARLAATAPASADQQQSGGGNVSGWASGSQQADASASRAPSGGSNTR